MGIDTARARLLRDREFRLLVAGQTITQVGTDISAVAFPLVAVLLLRATPFEVGVLVAVGNGSFLVAGLPAGAWLDRVRRRPAMIASDLARFAMLLTVPAAAAFHALTFAHLCAVAFGLGTARVLFDVAYQSYVPFLLGRRDLAAGNSRLEAIRAAAQAGGPGLGGGLVQLAGPAVAVLADAASYLASAACLAAIRRREPPPAARPRATVGRDAAEGLAFVLRHPALRRIALTSALSNLLLVGAGPITIVFLVRDVGLQPAAIGALLSASPVGAMLGAAAAGPLTRRVGATPVIRLSLLATTPFALLVPLGGPGWRVLLVATGMSALAFGQLLYSVAQLSFRQALCPEELLGRVNATMRVLVMGLLPLGGLLSGGLAQAAGVRTTLWMVGAGLVLAPLPLLLSPLSGRRAASPHPEA